MALQESGHLTRALKPFPKWPLGDPPVARNWNQNFRRVLVLPSGFEDPLQLPDRPEVSSWGVTAREFLEIGKATRWLFFGNLFLSFWNRPLWLKTKWDFFSDSVKGSHLNYGSIWQLVILGNSQQKYSCIASKNASGHSSAHLPPRGIVPKNKGSASSQRYQGKSRHMRAKRRKAKQAR